MTHDYDHNFFADRRSNDHDHRRNTNFPEDDAGNFRKLLSSRVEEVQSVLDQNTTLIQQVNKNHRSKIPDNLVRNVELIREIDGNISKVLSIYSDLSVNFTNMIRRQRKLISKHNFGSDGGKEVEDTTTSFMKHFSKPNF
ncbi:Protein ELF4-LIKE 1 [Bienertia sinuspersici]